MDLWHTSTLCMCIHYADVDVHVKARDWHLVSFPIVLLLIFRGRVSHWTLNFQIQLDWLASEPQLSSCLHLPSTGYTCAVSAEPSHFTWRPVDWMQAHMLVHESLYYPRHPPSPPSILWGILGGQKLSILLWHPKLGQSKLDQSLSWLRPCLPRGSTSCHAYLSLFGP